MALFAPHHYRGGMSMLMTKGIPEKLSSIYMILLTCNGSPLSCARRVGQKLSILAISKRASVSCGTERPPIKGCRGNKAAILRRHGWLMVRMKMDELTESKACCFLVPTSGALAGRISVIALAPMFVVRESLATRRVVYCASFASAAIMRAGGCPCLELWAAPFVFGLIASQLALAISFRFGARTPCCGHGLDHRRRQPHRRGGKLQQLNNQVHGRITSFRGRRRCQHTGLDDADLAPLYQQYANICT